MKDGYTIMLQIINRYCLTLPGFEIVQKDYIYNDITFMEQFYHVFTKVSLGGGINNKQPIGLGQVDVLPHSCH